MLLATSGALAVIGLFVIALVLSGLFMWIGAKLARIGDATFRKAILVALCTSVAAGAIVAIFSFIPMAGIILGFIFGLIAALFVIKAIFATSFGKAFLVWVFNVVAVSLAAVITWVIFIGSLKLIFG